jgi:hypothetical protein
MAEIFTLEALLALVKALDMELAERVFQPVREHLRRHEQLYSLVREELERGPIGGQNKDALMFCKFVELVRWNLAIGQKSTILSVCRRQHIAVFSALRVWLAQHFPRLLAQTEVLERVSMFRNRSSRFSEMLAPRKCNDTNWGTTARWTVAPFRVHHFRTCLALGRGIEHPKGNTSGRGNDLAGLLWL